MNADYIYYSKIEIITYRMYKPECAVTLDISKKELAFIRYSNSRDIIDSEGINLSNHEMEQILPFCNALEFEKYRDKEPDMSEPGFESYLDDGVHRKFFGVTDSYVPLIEISMDYSFDKKHQWPTEKLYNYLIQRYVEGKKRYRGWSL